MSQSGNLRQRLMCRSHHRLGVDVELLVHVGDLARGAKAVHANEAGFEANVAFPAARGSKPSDSDSFRVFDDSLLLVCDLNGETDGTDLDLI
jgi:hypothetical protein